MNDLESAPTVNEEKRDTEFARLPSGSDVLSIDECRRYLGNAGLSDDQLAAIKNYLIGIVDSALTAYLDGFR